MMSFITDAQAVVGGVPQVATKLKPGKYELKIVARHEENEASDNPGIRVEYPDGYTKSTCGAMNDELLAKVGSVLRNRYAVREFTWEQPDTNQDTITVDVKS